MVRRISKSEIAGALEQWRVGSIEPRGKEPPVEAMINMVLTQM